MAKGASSFTCHSPHFTAMRFIFVLLMRLNRLLPAAAPLPLPDSRENAGAGGKAAREASAKGGPRQVLKEANRA